jgi:hypothetical protein
METPKQSADSRARKCAKQKIVNFHLSIVQKIADIFGFMYIPNTTDKNWECPVKIKGISTIPGPDIIFKHEDFKKEFPFSVFCYRKESINIHDCLEEAKKDCLDETDWIIAHKRSMEEVLITMSFDTFEKMLVKGIKNDK